MSSENVIVFYDIASIAPLRTFTASPWKTRYALNFKGLHYRTQWVDMPDIASLRQGLGVPANRTLPDGSPHHTLPVIQDAATGKLLGDSFEIALYLDSAYPEAPRLFRPLTAGLTAALNAHVDGVFNKFISLCSQMPIDPRVADAVSAIYAQRAGAVSSDLQPGAEPPEKMLGSFEAALEELAKAYRHTGGTPDHLQRAGGTAKAQSQQPPPGREEAGPFLDGNEPVYADFIIGAWLKTMEAGMRAEDWQRVRIWQGGSWGRVVDALDKWSEIK